ncbi:putative regulator of the exon junction complex (EJC) [Trypoxylus dichotomus]
MISANVRDENGDTYIPASQRPDGTWRKARRIKEGYVPQEEVPLYESKGKQFVNRQLKPAVTLPPGTTAHHSIPGLFITEDKDKASRNKKKQIKKVETVAKQISDLKISEPPKPAKTNTTNVSAKVPSENQGNTQEAADPAKKLRNLKKRLREVEALEEKVKNGELTKPDPDQMKKINRKADLLVQIHDLERQL